jgi:hypothetical protein
MVLLCGSVECSAKIAMTALCCTAAAMELLLDHDPPRRISVHRNQRPERLIGDFAIRCHLQSFGGEVTAIDRYLHLAKYSNWRTHFHRNNLRSTAGQAAGKSPSRAKAQAM